MLQGSLRQKKKNSMPGSNRYCNSTDPRLECIFTYSGSTSCCIKETQWSLHHLSTLMLCFVDEGNQKSLLPQIEFHIQRVYSPIIAFVSILFSFYPAFLSSIMELRSQMIPGGLPSSYWPDQLNFSLVPHSGASLDHTLFYFCICVHLFIPVKLSNPSIRLSVLTILSPPLPDTTKGNSVSRRRR